MPSFLSRAMPRALFQALRPALLLAALTLAGAAHAATDNFNGGAVANCVYSSGIKTYSCSALSGSNDLAIADGYTVLVNGSATIGGSRLLSMSGSAGLQVSGTLSLTTSNLALSGATLVVGSKLTMSTNESSVTANISAATVDISSSNNTTFHGTLTSAGALAINSSMAFTGQVQAGATSIDNHVSLTANLQTGSLSMGNHVNFTGNINASGDIEVDTQSSIDGNVVAHNVVLHNAFTSISGNAAVNAITLGNKDYVGKVITCTGPGAVGCSCVTDNSGLSPGPVCAIAPPPTSSFDHILISHTGSALTCEPQTVTLTACANPACTAPHYSGGASVTLSPGGATATTGSNGTVNATVQQTSATPATLSASAAGAASASTCHNTVDNNNLCTMVFADAGFSFTIPNHRAEQAQSFTLRALKAGGSANVCVPLLANVTHNVNFKCGYNNPASGTVPIRVGPNQAGEVPLAANATSSCNAGGATVGLAFDASGTASATLQYADAGSMTLDAKLIPPSGPYAGVVLEGAATFVAAPSSFRFTVTKTVAGIVTNNPAAANDAGPVFIGAGQPFQAKLEALNAVNAVTANFGNESSAESYTLAQSLVAPLGGHMVAVGGSLAAMANGATPVANLSWDEVGIINFAAALANANGYLNSGMGVTGNVNIGRFIPDHFDTALNGTVPMPCPVNPAFGTPCPAPNTGGKFVYAAEPFDLSVKAYNLSGVITQNYEGLYARAVTLTAYNDVGASGATNQNPPAPPVAPAGNSLSPAAIAAGRFTKGAATADPASLPAYLFAYGYPATVDQLAPPTNIWLRATDTDGATSLRGAASNEALVSVVSGRLSVGNSYGSEALPMPVVAQAQYWGGKGTGWVNNPAYVNATVVALAGKLTFSNCQKNLANSGTNTCAVTFTLANDKLTFAGGTGKFTVAAPGRSGSVDITLSKGGVQAIPYLPSTTGRATFGVYRAGPVVYLREVY